MPTCRIDEALHPRLKVMIAFAVTAILVIYVKKTVHFIKNRSVRVTLQLVYKSANITCSPEEPCCYHCERISLLLYTAHGAIAVNNAQLCQTMIK